MATQGTIPPPARLAEERQALQAVLASSAFKRNPRLTSLLEYICQKHFAGDTDSIKEYSIATDVFRRSQSFDQATDSIVRVEVYRLRKKLREFYDGEGAHQPIEIVVATGHYLPEFVDRLPSRPTPDPAQRMPSEHAAGDEETFTPPPRPANRIRQAMLPAVVGVLLVALLGLSRTHPPLAVGSPSVPIVAPPTGTEVRIRCGYSKPIFKDREGNVWTGDRFFSGGEILSLPGQYIARTRDSELYLTARTGTFSYAIPVPPGTYEMRLHFAETTYSPASTLGGGENSRVFNVSLNGEPLLTQFDIVADAGANTADERIFKDIRPGPDGKIQLSFSGVLGAPMLNAVELVPGIPHRQLPIRMVAQNSFFVDKAGALWSPDTYFNGGQLAANTVAVGGTEDPGLFTGERYGNLTYALPADKGSYTLTLYLSEQYWGTPLSNTRGAGNRIFDIFCNGVALLRNLDIAREAGSGRGLRKTFHGLHPNAQGKLIVSLVPDLNYATVDALELEEETP